MHGYLLLLSAAGIGSRERETSLYVTRTDSVLKLALKLVTKNNTSLLHVIQSNVTYSHYLTPMLSLFLAWLSDQV